MMQKGLFLIIYCALSSVVVGQVEELRKAQDVRIGYIGGRATPSLLNVSKTPLVNPFIGTGGHGHTYPGATAPFGMIQLSPDTRHEGWDGCSGYHYSDSIIYGFSHTHLSGTGVSDYGDLLIVPQNGTAKIDPGYLVPGGYGDKFLHEKEEAKPGYYAVHLENGDIDVLLTVSERAGLHEYTFNNAKGKKYILIDLDHRDKLLSATLNTLDNRTITGSRTSEAWATEQHFYFHMELGSPYEKATQIMKDGRHKLLLTFPKTTQKIMIRVGISAVDAEGARLNLQKEIPDWDFKMTRAAVTNKWENELSRIQFSSQDKDVMTNFYTALYHSFIAPNVFDDVDGRYRGRDKQIHQLDDKDDAQYTVFSLWDTYRATHPLFTLTQVARTEQFIQTFLRQFDEGGDLPVWELAGNETECMIGFHSVSVMADAFTKGIIGYDARKALKAMLVTASLDEFAKPYFKENGYINAGEEPESVSKAMEYSYDYFCIAKMLELNGLPNKEYHKGQFNFLNHFDPSTKFMRARRDGLWFAPFDPAEVNFNYTEANSWQYSLYAPHAVGVLSTAIGGTKEFENWLDRLFTTKSTLSGRDQADITGLIGQYAHGNEPSHHMAYLYNYTASPHKTNLYVDRILKEMYSNAPDGLSGNEDCGQMSSWYVLSALGMYQIAPGNPYYEIGRPLMDEAVFQLENKKRLHILVRNNSAAAKYVQSVKLNGAVLNRNYLSHEEIMAGGELEYEMGISPNLERDKFAHAPTLSAIPDDFIPLPFFEQTDRVFQDQLTVSLSTLYPESYAIHYTMDGSEPDAKSPIYTTPITLDKETTIKAITMIDRITSAVVSNTFVKSDPGVHLSTKNEYANQYASTGPLALVDGIYGQDEFRTGDYQGFWEQDFDAEISFDTPRTLNEFQIGFLSDMKSWIFLPENVSFSYSLDGTTWIEVDKISLETETEEKMPAHKKEVSIRLPSAMEIQKFRVHVDRTDTCPSWHLGAGNGTWLFVDEISYR